ncbi:putative oxygen-independent coproporphyrinogen III oxidase [Magnetospirillum sp. XM-1]|uniref:radical SAM family heme chaperone HemW n=1 Tax=Magnetospirillum sp. XM-1 TaxID=1663591 RepID=UPI00073DC86D|nr:radical SAM family heme chaperone HemW [Magnetospirillum sp. XM-1]CUW37870.1 putative oxygen-independent coproporphyrinogen III oxidase [Magnetospirillum sp. XM-1]
MISSSPGFGIYIHWPFCLSKCPYCDFNSHAAQSMDQARWRAALLAELDHFASETAGRTPTSIFFGGGTPSLMAPETVGALVAMVKSRWACAPDLEVTLEANPTSVEADRFRAFHDAGINRLSLGIQALDAESLAFLGRRHSADEALAALKLAQAIFPRVSFDLIYTRPGQTEAGWRAELARALDLAGEHLSLYQLTVEDGTMFAPAQARGDFVLPDEDEATAQFEATQELCEAAGLPAYEISNHARPGAECRHNLTYWTGGEWLGVGPGAHGRFGGEALAQARSPGTWLAQVEQNGHATETRYPLDPAERLSELALMGLRLRNGLGPALLAELRPAFDPAGLARMIEGGFLVEDAHGLRTTDKGRLVLNAVLGELLA